MGQSLVLFAMLGIEPWTRLVQAGLARSWRACHVVLLGYGILLRTARNQFL